jgi:hypothetical protein
MNTGLILVLIFSNLVSMSHAMTLAHGNQQSNLNVTLNLLKKIRTKIVLFQNTTYQESNCCRKIMQRLSTVKSGVQCKAQVKNQRYRESVPMTHRYPNCFERSCVLRICGGGNQKNPKTGRTSAPADFQRLGGGSPLCNRAETGGRVDRAQSVYANAVHSSSVSALASLAVAASAAPYISGNTRSDATCADSPKKPSAVGDSSRPGAARRAEQSLRLHIQRLGASRAAVSASGNFAAGPRRPPPPPRTTAASANNLNGPATPASGAGSPGRDRSASPLAPSSRPQADRARPTSTSAAPAPATVPQPGPAAARGLTSLHHSTLAIPPTESAGPVRSGGGDQACAAAAAAGALPAPSAGDRPRSPTSRGSDPPAAARPGERAASAPAAAAAQAGPGGTPAGGAAGGGGDSQGDAAAAAPPAPGRPAAADDPDSVVRAESLASERIGAPPPTVPLCPPAGPPPPTSPESPPTTPALRQPGGGTVFAIRLQLPLAAPSRPTPWVGWVTRSRCQPGPL